MSKSGLTVRSNRRHRAGGRLAETGREHEGSSAANSGTSPSPRAFDRRRDQRRTERKGEERRVVEPSREQGMPRAGRRGTGRSRASAPGRRPRRYGENRLAVRAGLERSPVSAAETRTATTERNPPAGSDRAPRAGTGRATSNGGGGRSTGSRGTGMPPRRRRHTTDPRGGPRAAAPMSSPPGCGVGPRTRTEGPSSWSS